MKTQDKMIVLMADDDDDDCMLVKEAIEESGARAHVHCVDDGIKLMEFLFSACAPPDLILLDLNMPRKDGRQALKEIKSAPALAHIPVVVFTTSKEKKDIAYSRKMGANSFVTKPETYIDWVNTMKSLMDNYLGVQ